MTLLAHYQKLERPHSDYMDDRLGVVFPVPSIPDGFVRLIDYMGDEAAIVQAARVSYGHGTKTPSSDKSLIRYLYRNQHTSPFEMCEIKLHLKMPIFVARQWVRHRTASMNEYSGRYSVMPDEFHRMDRLNSQSKKNKQGRAAELELSMGTTDNWNDTAQQAFNHYNHLLDCDVSREQARIHLPLSTFTEFYWKMNLHNLLHFLKLRMDPHAQKEIQEYAGVIYRYIINWMPSVASAFADYTREAITFSAPKLRFFQAYKADPTVRPNQLPMSKSELREFEQELLTIGFFTEEELYND